MRLGSAPRSSFAPGLALPYPALENAGLHLRRGQTSLTVAAPGVGKSQLWANLAYRMRVPCLYWSADTDQFTVTCRSVAMQTGYKVDQIAGWLTDGSGIGDRLLADLDTRHVDWVFDSPITGRLAEERLLAFASLHGEFPHLFVIDNMSNAIQSVENERAEIIELQTQLQRIARHTKAHIAVLHHAKGEFDSGNRPIPQSGALQNPFKIVEVGLTLYRPEGDNDRLAVNVVKNRGGRSDPAAKHPVVLPISFETASVMGYQKAEEAA